MIRMKILVSFNDPVAIFYMYHRMERKYDHKPLTASLILKSVLALFNAGISTSEVKKCRKKWSWIVPK